MYLIGSGAGFSGDRTDAPVKVVEAIAARGQGGAIIFETMGERTLALGQFARLNDPEAGYEPLLEEFITPILKQCIEAGILIIGNFGCANPPAAARLLRRIAAAQGLAAVRIALVEGDDILDKIDVSSLPVWEGDAGLHRPDASPISANAYIGARSIAAAITAGAQVVITGRVADPALVLGPLVAHYGWDWTDWDRLAAGTLAGHLLECGAQVSGGYFADPGFKDVPGLESIGFPIAEIEADGTFVITKPAGTGGLVDRRTVTEQMLYEIHDPSSYLTPDVTLDITHVTLAETGQDRVRVCGARGRPAPVTLKATVGFQGDVLGEAEISYAGPNAPARARLAGEVIKRRLVLRRLELRHRLDVIGLTSAFDDDNGTLLADLSLPEAGDVRLRLTVGDSNRARVEAALREVNALYCCGPAGGGGVRMRVTPRICTVSYEVPRSMVHTSFRMMEDEA